MNGMRVGTSSLPTRGSQEFSYSEAWLRSSQFRPLSLSLPAGLGASTLRGTAVESWFDNLLPAASTSAFDLLAAIGRDRAGAMQLLPRSRSQVASIASRPGP